MAVTQAPEVTGPVVGVTRRRKPHARFSSGHLVMIGAGLVGAVLTIALLRQADTREDIAVASHALTPGMVLSEDDLRWTSARVDEDLPVLRRTGLGQFDGMVVSNRVAEGEVLAPSDLRPASAPNDRRAVSVPIDRERAVGGDLAPGDRVDVVYAGDREVAIVVAGAEVLDVDDDRGGGLGQGIGEFSVTLAVTAQEMQLLTAAISDGDLLLARSTGSKSADDEPPLSISSRLRD